MTRLPVPPHLYLTIRWVSFSGVSGRRPEDGTCESAGSSKGWSVSVVRGPRPCSDPALLRVEKEFSQMPPTSCRPVSSF